MVPSPSPSSSTSPPSALVSTCGWLPQGEVSITLGWQEERAPPWLLSLLSYALLVRPSIRPYAFIRSFCLSRLRFQLNLPITIFKYSSHIKKRLASISEIPSSDKSHYIDMENAKSCSIIIIIINVELFMPSSLWIKQTKILFYLYNVFF